MIIKLLALGLTLGMSYILTVFFVPEFADKYGNIALNTKIRDIKNASLEFASGSDTPASLIDKLTGTSKEYIDETVKTYENIQNTVSGKLQDVKSAADSVEKAYQAVNDAKADIQKVVNIAA